MIIRFSVSNWRSIRSEQEISFVASSFSEGRADTSKSPAISERLLPTIAIYGANASGKSNLIEALRVLRNLVLQSHRRGGPGDQLPLQPFLLDEKHRKEPTSFALDFIASDVRYQFELVADKERVIKESLYAFPSKRPQLWYARDESGFEFGRSLKGKNASIQDLTRANSLFLSAAATSNHEQLTLIFNFFKDGIMVYDDLPPFAVANYQEYVDDLVKKAKIVAMLKRADIGIEDILTTAAQEKDPKIKALEDDLQALLKKHIGGNQEADFPMPKRPNFQFMHRGTDGVSEFGLQLESRGTQQLLNLLPPIFESLEAGSTLLVDEIDTSLHPLLAREVVYFFQSHKTNPKGAQLLFTTHDASLLSKEILRRDQVWFTEKDHCGATAVFALSEIKTRQTDNFQKGYLEGRYGAVPYLGKLAQVLIDETNIDAETAK